LSLFDALSIGVRVPVVLTRVDISDTMPAQTYGGIGDLGIVLSGAIARHRETRIGWQLAGTLPSATSGTLTGEPYVTLTPGILLSQGFGRVRLAALLAYHIRKRYVVFGVERDDELVAKLGARYMWPVGIGLLGEWSTLIGIGGRSARRDETTSEVDVGLRLGDERRVALDVGVGSAVWPGQYGLGAPQLRTFLMLRGALGPGPRECTTGPEDVDGYQDADGCADLDNDRDGIPDSADACPDAAEDRDGFQDRDGCPDLDNDGDGVSDARDLCPESAEDLDDFQDGDGCPEPDNDEDGVPDAPDRCPLDAEDRDNFEDEDGCPEAGPAQTTVTRSGSHLLISDRVYFGDQSDTLRAVSTPLLDAVANAFKELPGKPRLRVEGHSDDSGNAQHNVDLSYRRARAVVEYLKRRGIATERLEYVGLGSAQPLGPHTSPEGRALNRRAEFVLLGQ
jgi:outer membrane protein OmpA-like peptidoglycan-associated protein